MFQCEGMCKTGRQCLRMLKKEGYCKQHAPQCSSIGDCPICLCEIKDDMDDMVVTRCGHTFHKSCLQQWDDFCIGKPYQCPLCRATLDSKHKKKVLEAEPIDEFQFVQILQNLDDDETEIASLLMTIL